MSHNTSSNSLSSITGKFVKLQNNSISVISALKEFLTNPEESFTINLSDSDGKVVSYDIASLQHLITIIERLENNYKNLTSDNNASSIRLSDGSYKKLIKNRHIKEPAAISGLQVPIEFMQKPNWLFDNMLSPRLYISIDTTNVVDPNTDRIIIKRMLLNLDTEAKQLYFDNNIKNRNDIDYNILLTDLTNLNITFLDNEELAPLELPIMKYSGNFSVLNIINSGTTTNYKLDKLTYTDLSKSATDTETLTIGQKLLVGEDTMYEIVSIDTTLNMVTLRLMSGYKQIGIGADVLKFYTESFKKKEVKLNIGFDQNTVIFMKPIDKDFNVTSYNWSVGFAFTSNDLSIVSNSGKVSLLDYYKSEVTDFGAQFIEAAKQRVVPRSYGITPDAPVLDIQNAKVVAINTHKLNSSEIEDIRKKASTKIQLKSELEELDNSISKKREELNNNTFSSEAERRVAKNLLDTIVRDKESKSSLYRSIIKELSSYQRNKPAALTAAKYRLRSFFDMPKAKVHPKTGPQEVIQFVINYRYLRLDGNSAGAQEIPFVDSNGKTVRAYWSPWETVQSRVRNKVIDSNGNVSWEVENVQDADVDNINQFDIPISKGEQVEVKIKSISEAGWPNAPIVSEWSTSIVVPFPSNLESEDEAIVSIKEAAGEETKIDFQAELDSIGLTTHLRNSYTKSDKYYAHKAEDIDSGSTTADGNVINLLDKIRQIEQKLERIEKLVENAKGSLQVYIVDDAGNKQIISNNTTVKLFAGYYEEVIADLPISQRKGAIITKVYNICIENSAASPLEMVSRYPGGYLQALPSSTGDPTDYSKRRYDLVPVTYGNIENATVIQNNHIQSQPHQSSQIKSQWLYFRYTDIGLQNDLYFSEPITTQRYYTLIAPTTGFQHSFIYNPNSPGTNGFLSDFCIHTSSPDVVGNPSITALRTPTVTSSTMPAKYPVTWHAAKFDLDASIADGTKQMQLYQSTGSGTTAWALKMGFRPNDRYLIGKNTCGSYLYPSATSYDQLSVDGTDYNAKRVIEFGDTHVVKVPVVFQYRMTDCYGDDVNDQGTARIGGLNSQPSNLTYTKKLGIDVYVKDQSPFQFDVEVTAKYKKDNLTSISNVSANVSNLKTKRDFN